MECMCVYAPYGLCRRARCKMACLRGFSDADAPGRAVRMALNQTLSDEAAPLPASAEVAFFPPVTGG